MFLWPSLFKSSLRIPVKYYACTQCIEFRDAKGFHVHKFIHNAPRLWIVFCRFINLFKNEHDSRILPFQTPFIPDAPKIGLRDVISMRCVFH